jgi:hypothetical protein
MVAIVPKDVPVATEVRHASKNVIGRKNFGDIS